MRNCCTSLVVRVAAAWVTSPRPLLCRSNAAAGRAESDCETSAARPNLVGSAAGASGAASGCGWQIDSVSSARLLSGGSPDIDCVTSTDLRTLSVVSRVCEQGLEVLPMVAQEGTLTT